MTAIGARRAPQCPLVEYDADNAATYPNSRMSPTLTLPLKFRESGVEACDHSECFLFSYDLHRLYPTPERPPRIIMNPDVRLAYKTNWWKWHNGVLRIPVVEWWLCEFTACEVVDGGLTAWPSTLSDSAARVLGPTLTCRPLEPWRPKYGGRLARRVVIAPTRLLHLGCARAALAGALPSAPGAKKLVVERVE